MRGKMTKAELKKHLTALLFLCVASLIRAADTAKPYESLLSAFGFLKDGNAGLTSFRSLNIPVGGRSEAMGTAFSAMTDDVSVFEYNPAASSVLKQTELALFHNFWIADSAVDTLMFTRRTNNLGYGGALKSFYIPFTEYNIFGERASTGYYSETTAAFNISYNFFAGYTFKGIALGTNLKTSFRSIPDYSNNISGQIIPKSGLSQSAVALSADAGMLLRFNMGKFYASRDPNFNIGLTLHNAGFAWTGFGKNIRADDPLPSYAAAGISYKMIKPLTLAFEFRQPINMWNFSKSERASAAAGAEIRITDFFALQAGFLLKGVNPKISLGSSLEWKKMIFNAAYSFDLTSSLNPVNKISLAVKIDLGDAGRQKKEEAADKLYTEGMHLYAQGEFEKAIEKWRQVLELYPRFDPAKKGIAAAQGTLDLHKRIRDIQTLY